MLTKHRLLEFIYSATKCDQELRHITTVNQWVGGKKCIGPIPVDWLSRAAMLPGHALAVGLCLWSQYGPDMSYPQIALTHSLLAILHVSRDSGRRGLLELENAGLVQVSRIEGMAPMVSIIC